MARRPSGQAGEATRAGDAPGTGRIHDRDLAAFTRYGNGKDLDSMHNSDGKPRRGSGTDYRPAVVYTCEPSAWLALTSVADAAGYLTGDDADSFTSHPDHWVARIHEEDGAAYREACTLALAEGGSTVDYRFLHADGSYRWVRDSLLGVRNDEGDITTLQGTCVDVTDLAAAGDGRDDAERLRSVTEAAVDGILTIDEQGVIQSANPAAALLFGYGVDEMVGVGVTLLMPEPYKREHASYLDNYDRTGEPKIIGIGREVVGRRKDGTTFPMYLSVGEARVAGRPLFTGIVQDITARKAADELASSVNAELEERVAERTVALARETAGHQETADLVKSQAAILEGFLRSARCILWRAHTTRADVSLVWHPIRGDESELQAFLPLALEEGESYFDAWRRNMPDDDRRRVDDAWRLAVREGRAAYSLEYRCADSDGGMRWLHDDVSIESLPGNRCQVVGVTTDITERERSTRVERVLSDVLEVAHSASSMEDMYRRIHESLASVVDLTGFSIGLAEDEPDTFSFAYWADENGAVQDGGSITIPRSRVAIVARAKNTLYMTADQSRASAANGDIDLYGAHPGAWLGAPLVIEDRLVGVMRVVNSSQTDPYSARDIDVVTYVAQQVAIAIDRRRAHDALRQEQRLFESLMANVPDIIYLKDTESRFLRINDMCARELNLEHPDAAVGLTDADIYPGDRSDVYRADEVRVMRGGEPILGRVSGDGQGNWVSTTKIPIHDDDGVVVGLVGVNRNVSALMSAQDALRESETQRTKLLEQMIAVQEEERARIARELHDQVGQELTSVLIGLRVIESATTTEDATRQATALREVTAGTLEDVRQIAFDMRPSSLDDLGMETALRRDLEVLSQNAGFGSTFHAHNAEGISLPTEMEVGLYRIAHTALTNVVRHARAQNVAVVMQTQRVNDGCRVSLLIEDDGVGFDADAVAQGPVEGRFGILSMQERARLMGGEVTVDSAPGEGVSVLIEVVSPG
jgi:PAS domain S-box-containing protein